MVLLVLSALASEPHQPYDLSLAPVLIGQSKKGGKKGGKGKKKGPHWERDFYVQPTASGRFYKRNNGETQSLATVGGEAGYTYNYVGGPRPHWYGRTRGAVEYIADNDSSGLDLRVGTFFGPQGKTFGATFGVDGFYNTWTYGNQTLPESYGLEVPVALDIHRKTTWAQVGASVAYLAEESRRVDWSQQDIPGVGHEMSLFAGAGARIENLDLGVRYTYRITAIGPQQELSGFVTVTGANIDDVWEMLGAGEDSNSNSGSGSGKKSDGKKSSDSDGGKKSQ